MVHNELLKKINQDLAMHHPASLPSPEPLVAKTGAM
jgi:hypothetical protein